MYKTSCFGKAQCTLLDSYNPSIGNFVGVKTTQSLLEGSIK